MSTRAGLARGGDRVAATRRRLVQRDGNLCGGPLGHGCGMPIDMALSGLDVDGPTLGHVLAAAVGGSDRDDNLVLQHRRCNLHLGLRTMAPRAVIAEPRW